METTERASRRGYLVENYRLFHLRDATTGPFEQHYHEFDKVVMFYSGEAEYIVEGRRYRLLPGDVLFVRHHDIHMPVIAPGVEYERAILWIDPTFLSSGERGVAGMDGCFSASSAAGECLYRPDIRGAARLRRLVTELERSKASEEFGSGLLADTYFLQLLVELNRLTLGEAPQPRDADPKLSETIRHINGNLAADLSVDTLAAMSCRSRYHFMRCFKETTGCTVHEYVQQKRMARAAELLAEGESVTAAAQAVGYAEYSTFLRAFRKRFGAAPTEAAARVRVFPEGDASQIL